MSELPYPVATVWRRFIALIYDLFILLALSMLYGAVTAVIYVAVNGSGEHDYTPMMGGIWYKTGWVLTLMGFYVFFWFRAGQTVGMRAWRIKLVNQQGEAPSLVQCFLRALAGPFSLIVLGLGYFWAWIDPNNDCLHDKASKTRVIHMPKTR